MKKDFLAFCEVERYDYGNDQILIDCIVFTNVEDYAEAAERVENSYPDSEILSLKTTLVNKPYLPITYKAQERLIQEARK